MCCGQKTKRAEHNYPTSYLQNIVTEMSGEFDAAVIDLWGANHGNCDKCEV